MKKTIQITADNLPAGNWWDDHGGCFRAVREGALPDGWYWQAANSRALKTGYNGQTLYPFYMPKQIKLPAHNDGHKGSV